MLTLDYRVDVDALEEAEGKKKGHRISQMSGTPDFRLSYYPHRLKDFTEMLDEAVPNAKHTILSDFQPSEKVENPGFYIHVMEKQNWIFELLIKPN